MARGSSALLALVTVAVVMVLTTGLLSIGLRRAQRTVETRGELLALFAADSGVEEAKMRLSPGAPAAARITPGGTPSWRAYILSGHTRAEIAAGLDPTYGLNQVSGYTRPEPTEGYVFVDTVQSRGSVRWTWVRIEHKVNGAGHIVALNPLDGTETTAPGYPPVLLVTARGEGGENGREVRAELRPAVQAAEAAPSTIMGYTRHVWREFVAR